MCGRFYVPEKDLDDFAGLVNKIEKELLKKAGEMYPGDYVPVITPNHKYDSELNDSLGNIRHEVHAIKWGFPVIKGRPLINARSETVREKPMFKIPFSKRRCLIPARGFFEWKKDENNKKRIKHYISFIDSRMMYLAGFYWFFKNQDGIPSPYFTILTAQANDDIRPIHDRMPVIINDSNIETWLSENSGNAIIDNLLRPLDKGLLKITQEYK
ncbi:MAG: SOS response-associated peptidase [Clostridiaceae bacterium]|jgi:putative SOS response-associated peptidase YedK|nr:SOS response-associated peptidase [Clostridiaceae bacterium]